MIIVTGSAGFIGYHLTKKLLEKGHTVLGIDNLKNFEDLKKDRISQLEKYSNFEFHTWDLTEINPIVKFDSPSCIIHLAAQSNIEFSLTKPQNYIKSNIASFSNVLEFCRKCQVKLLFGSSTLAYTKVNSPMSLYIVSKKINETLAYSYSNLYNISCTGLRFYTVYGPWGRPDMTYFNLTKNLLERNPLYFNNVNRNFTYIDDVIEGICCLIDKKDTSYNLYNIGEYNPESMESFVSTLEKIIKFKADKHITNKIETVVERSNGKIDTLKLSSTPLYEGLKKFTDWYIDYF